MWALSSGTPCERGVGCRRGSSATLGVGDGTDQSDTGPGSQPTSGNRPGTQGAGPPPAPHRVPGRKRLHLRSVRVSPPPPRVPVKAVTSSHRFTRRVLAKRQVPGTGHPFAGAGSLPHVDNVDTNFCFVTSWLFSWYKVSNCLSLRQTRETLLFPGIY